MTRDIEIDVADLLLDDVTIGNESVERRRRGFFSGKAARCTRWGSMLVETIVYSREKPNLLYSSMRTVSFLPNITANTLIGLEENLVWSERFALHGVEYFSCCFHFHLVVHLKVIE